MGTNDAPTTEDETYANRLRSTLADIDRALALDRRSATMMVMVGGDAPNIWFNLHDPHWRRALEAFKAELTETLAREVDHG